MYVGKVGLAAVAACATLFVAQPVLAQEREVHEVRKLVIGGGGGHLGVVLDEVDAKAVERLKLKEERGAVVREVRPDTPAAAAGLQVDDVIVGYQGQPVESALALARFVRETPPGRRISLEIVRQGGPQKVTATLGERKGGSFNIPVPDMEMPELPEIDLPHGEMSEGGPMMQWTPGHRVGGPGKLGLQFQPISGQLAEHFKVKGGRGLLVVSVKPDGPAAKAGVKAGDVLLRLGAAELPDAAELHKAVAHATPGEEVALAVQRDGQILELKIVIGGAKPTPAPQPEKKKNRT